MNQELDINYINSLKCAVFGILTIVVDMNIVYYFAYVMVTPFLFMFFSILYDVFLRKNIHKILTELKRIWKIK